MCCMRLAEKYRMQKSPKIRHLGTIAQFYRVVSWQLKHASTISKNVLSSNIPYTCPQNMADSGPLTAEIGSGVWGTPANFNRFCVLVSLLQRRRSPEANQTLHDVWPSPRLLQYIHFRGLLPPNGTLPGAKFTLRPSLAFSYIGSVTTPHSSSGRQRNFVAWCKEWNYGTFADGVIDIRLGGHLVGHRPTF